LLPSLSGVEPQGDQSIPEVTVTANRLNQLWQCTKAQYGFGDGSTQPGLDAYGFLSNLASDAGLPSLPTAANWVVTSTGIGRIASEIGSLPIYKPLFEGFPVMGSAGGGASSFTNLLNFSSLIGGRSGWGYRVFFQGSAAAFARGAFGSVRVATVLGRANVVVGGTLLLYDATSIGICTFRG
jgi:hypothetical protein